MHALHRRCVDFFDLDQALLVEVEKLVDVYRRVLPTKPNARTHSTSRFMVCMRWFR